MQEKIIEILKSNGGYVSGQELSGILGVSRQAVWKAINALKTKGYEIDSVTNKGYRLMSTPDFLSEECLRSSLKSQTFSKNVIVLDTVTSTNDYLKNLGNEDCESGTLVATREQTKGKGRLGRVWQSNKDEGIAFSFLLRPQLALNEITAITPLSGLAVCKAIRAYTGLDCKIKWPNDIIVGNKKLVGILTEISAEFDAVEYTVTGIGINVGQTEFPEEIAYKATSILLETGKNIDKNDFLAYVVDCIDKELFSNNLRLTQQALDEYTALCATINRNVSFTRGDQTLSGVAVGIESDGELKVMLQDGTIRNINSGEVTVQGIY